MGNLRMVLQGYSAFYYDVYIYAIKSMDSKYMFL